jgi:beta-glucosidase
VSASGPGERFLWGAATASYQIEGSPLADGATPSIWHEFAHRRGTIRNGDTGDVACDHYRRYREDVAEMGRLGLQAYRFSASWSRVVPEAGRINPAGLDFYDRLVDSLLEEGIVPFCTLFHWDTPAWLEREGGFVRRGSVEAFAHYAGVMFARLGDRVKHWITVNEPLVYATHGYLFGSHAPGHRWRIRRMFAAAHHLLLSHCSAARLLRDSVGDARVGVAQHQVWIRPRDPGNAGDLRAADFAEQVINRFYIDPLFLGGYPPEVVRRFRNFMPRNYERDLPGMIEPGDFVGLNYYQSQRYTRAFWIPLVGARQVPTPGAPRNPLGWEIDPEGLYRLLLRLHADYGAPQVYVTENGYPTVEAPGGTPLLDDPERVGYLQSHIRAIGRARGQGVPVDGYFVWSLMDNFEWAEGYRARFGLLRVDYASQTRSWRRSARWYRERIQAGAPEGE